jgi:four helix bundle protein
MRSYFDHEKLDVYQLELRFITWVTALLVTIKRRSTDARIAEVSDQLDRARLSALLNTAEGNGRRQRRTRAKFFDDARGPATECAACLDALVAKGVCSGGETDEGKHVLLRIASMLTELIERFDISSSSSSSSSIIREEPDEKGFEDEGRE